MNTGSIKQSQSALLDMTNGTAPTAPDAADLGTIEGTTGTGDTKIAPKVKLSTTVDTAKAQYAALGKGIVKMVEGKVNTNQAGYAQLLGIWVADGSKSYIANISTESDTDIYNELSIEPEAGVHCFYITIGGTAEQNKAANNDVNAWGDDNWTTGSYNTSDKTIATGDEVVTPGGIDGEDYIMSIKEVTVTNNQ